MCARLEGDGPLVEEFELPLWLAVGNSFGVAQPWRQQCSSRRLLSATLSICGGVVFCWVCLFACVVSVVVVGWWCCPLAAVEEVRMVRVGREVQRI